MLWPPEQLGWVGVSEPGTLAGYVRHSAIIFGVLMAGAILGITANTLVGGPIGEHAALAFPVFAIWAAGFFMGKDYAETVADPDTAAETGGERA